MQKRQEKIQQNLNKFNYIKNKKLKLIENDRYKDNQNIYERQKLIQKFFSQNEVDMNQANNIPGNENMQNPGQDLNFLNNMAMIQMMNNGGFGNMNAMMGNNEENNNQDSQ